MAAALSNLKKQRQASLAKTATPLEAPVITTSALNDPTSDLEIFAKEVLNALANDNLPPTPNNFALYFDRILEDKSESLRRQIGSVLELEEDHHEDTSIELEKILKQGFGSIKNMLHLSTTIYKNTTLMDKLLEKRLSELSKTQTKADIDSVVGLLSEDVAKLNMILKKQVTHMKDIYDETAATIKKVESETIFDNRYGVYNKRFLISKLSQEVQLIEEFKHKSSLIIVSLMNSVSSSADSEKVRQLMVRTVARLLLKTSRRSDVVAHYGSGIFAIILKHTDIENAKRASDRLYDLVGSSNFFIAEQEITLRIAIGVSELNKDTTAENALLVTIEAMQESQKDSKDHYVVGKL